MEPHDEIEAVDEGEWIEVVFDASYGGGKQIATLKVEDRDDEGEEVVLTASNAAGEEYRLEAPNTIRKVAGNTYRPASEIYDALVFSEPNWDEPEHEIYRTDIATTKSSVYVDDEGFFRDGEPIEADPIDHNVPFFECSCGVEDMTLAEAADHLNENTDMEVKK